MKKKISGIRVLLVCGFILLLLAETKADLPYRYAKVLNGVDDHHKMFTVAAKDAWGMIWLISGGELYRYDGINVTPFNKLYEQKIPFEDIQSIAIDPWNRIWINGRNHVFVFDMHSWTFINDPSLTKDISNKKAISFCRFGDDFFVATEAGEVWQIQQQHKIFLFSFDLKRSLKRRTIDRLFKVDHQSIWLIFNGNLYQYDRQRKQRTKRPVPLSIFNFTEDILPVKNGLLLRSYKDGYYIYNGKEFTQSELKSDKANDFTNWNHWAFEDANTVKIFHKSGQYFEYSRDTSFKLLKKGYHRLDENVFHKKLNGWLSAGEEWLLSTDDGLYAVFPTALNFEFMEIGSARGMIKQKGRYFFGGYGQVHHMNEQGALAKLHNAPANNYYAFLAIHPDSSCVALEGNFLAYLVNETIVKAPLHIPSSYKERFSSMALCMAKYKADTILVGTANGIWKYSRRSGNVQPLTDSRGTFSSEAMRILSIQYTNDIVTFTSEEGYYSFAKNTFQKLYPQDDTRLLIHDHLKMGDKTYLATKGRGIVLIQAGNARTFTVEEGLSSNIIYQLHAVNGFIFAGTHHGLSVLKEDKTFNYHVVDGLPFEEFNHQALYYDKQTDRLFMGGTGGYIAFNPNELTTAQHEQPISPPRLVSLSIGLRENKFINNFASTNLHTINLPQETMMLSLNFSRPDNYRTGYRLFYRIEPYMDDFQVMPCSNQINLSGVKAGQYTVHIKLISNRNAAAQTWTWTLEKAPLFFETQIFYLLILVCIAAITSFLLYERERRSRGEKQLRRQISSDLHDEVGGLLTGISMQADLLRYRPAGQQLENIDAISQYSRDATQMMDDIVWTIDTRNNYQGSLEDRVKFLAQQMLQPLEIELSFDVQSDYDRKIPQSVRQNTYLILKEALHNICKHAQPSRVDITFKINSRSYFLEIRNDGVSKRPAMQGIRSGQGTKNMKRRAQQIKARLYIWKRDDHYFVQLSGYFHNSPWQRWLRRFKRKWNA